MRIRLLTLPLYIIFLILFTFFSYFFVDPNLIYLSQIYTGFYASQRFLVSGIFLLSTILFFVFYYVFLRQIKKNILDLKLVIFITSVILSFSYPAMLSYDIFNYVTTAKVAFTYHENPYIVKPNELIGDKNLSFTRASNKIALYGPTWILATGIPNLLSFGNFIINLFLQKLLILFFYLLTCSLILKITRSPLYTAIFALNPLVIIESFVSAHNDIFMIFFALLSIYLLSKNRITNGFVSYIFSIFVKYSTLFLVPVIFRIFFLKYKKREINWRKIYYQGALFMLVIFLLSFLREMYPWYAIWFLAFASIVPNKRTLTYIGFGFSVGLLLSYIPYMYTGSYLTNIKNVLIFIPVAFVLLLEFGGRSWLKKFS